jgi:DNA-binding HxlR family transcriptional regulator
VCCKGVMGWERSTTRNGEDSSRMVVRVIHDEWVMTVLIALLCPAH